MYIIDDAHSFLVLEVINERGFNDMNRNVIVWRTRSICKTGNKRLKYIPRLYSGVGTHARARTHTHARALKPSARINSEKSKFPSFIQAGEQAWSLSLSLFEEHIKSSGSFY